VTVLHSVSDTKYEFQTHFEQKQNLWIRLTTSQVPSMRDNVKFGQFNDYLTRLEVLTSGTWRTLTSRIWCRVAW